MPRGSKQGYTGKQRRRASKIENSGTARGMSSERAKQMTFATVNKEEGGGKRSGSGRGKKVTRSASSRGGHKSSGHKSART